MAQSPAQQSQQNGCPSCPGLSPAWEKDGLCSELGEAASSCPSPSEADSEGKNTVFPCFLCHGKAANAAELPTFRG